MNYKVILKNGKQIEFEADNYFDDSITFDYYTVFYKEKFLKRKFVARFRQEDIELFYVDNKNNKNNHNNKNDCFYYKKG